MADKELRYDAEDQEVVSQRDGISEGLASPDKTFAQRIWPAFACGAGLFSDGYFQSVIGPVNTCLKKIYGDQYSNSVASQNVSSIAFAGTVVGQLVFGVTSDHWSRKWSLVISTVILIVFGALGAGSYGAGGSPGGLFAALTAYRFFLGIGIGGEYPAGSVACAESTGELKSGTRNRWFALFTNCAIDWGFVFGNFFPFVILAAQPTNYELTWRLSLALGCVFPISLFFIRLRLHEPEAYKQNKFQKANQIPYKLVFKYYGRRLATVCAIWFIYDFLTYPFSIYSTAWLDDIAPDRNTWQNFGWGVLINFFYVPGAILGAFTADWMGPKLALITFLIVQAIFGFAMSGAYAYLKEPQNVAGFVVLYGLFLAVGEMGPGDNIGLIASKTSASGIRGQYYGIAAACGKIGGLVGSYVFPIIVNDGGSNVVHQGQYPFFVASSLILFSALLALTLPPINQDTIQKEDRDFKLYLEEKGYDTSQIGVKEL